MVMVMMMAEELRELDLGWSLGARRLILAQSGNRVRHRLEKVRVARRRRKLAWLRRRGLSAGPACHGQRSRGSEQAGNFLVHV
jgi:hypothetical protein